MSSVDTVRYDSMHLTCSKKLTGSHIVMFKERGKVIVDPRLNRINIKI